VGVEDCMSTRGIRMCGTPKSRPKKQSKRYTCADPQTPNKKNGGHPLNKPMGGRAALKI